MNISEDRAIEAVQYIEGLLGREVDRDKALEIWNSLNDDKQSKLIDYYVLYSSFEGDEIKWNKRMGGTSPDSVD